MAGPPVRSEPSRVYVDSSVFGGAFDEEFAEPTGAFFDQVRRGLFRIVISPLVQQELQQAPEAVRLLFDEMLLVAEVATVSEGAVRLQQAYLAARIVGQRAMTDALHVALATVAECDAIVSWNFHHIVNFGRIPKYNAVNVLQGFGSIAIHSPQEVLIDEDEDA